jgi:hypothetical protein
MVAPSCRCWVQMGATTEPYHVSVECRQDRAGSRWDKVSEEAKPGSDEAVAALHRVGGGGREYIKAKNLQNPENKREILADNKLQAIFDGKSTVSMFEMNKHLAQHLS